MVVRRSVRRPLRHFWRAALTEIYRCGVCSDQEILRRNGRGQETGGRTWPHNLEVYNGGAAYSCLSTMPAQFGGDARLGLMFERDGEQCSQGSSCYIAFASFPAKWD
eukprot:COSAG01_NODE_1731_length_9369_cov_35.048220_5_plen_107_part_00